MYRRRLYNAARQSGASAVEYGLVMAVLVSLMIGASTVMKAPISELFLCAAKKVASMVNGGSYDCGGIQLAGGPDNDQVSEGATDGNRADTNATTQQPETEAQTNQTAGPDWPSPSGQGERGCDGFGCGHYSAPRGSRDHAGIDYEANAGADVVAVIGGEVTRIGWPYANADYRYIEITTDDGYVVREMYVSPDANLVVGSQVTQGEVIGTVQSLQPRYPGITDHIHVEVRENGVVIDPATVIDAN